MIEPEPKRFGSGPVAFDEARLINKTEDLPSVIAVSLERRIRGKSLQKIERPGTRDRDRSQKAVISAGPYDPCVPAFDHRLVILLRDPGSGKRVGAASAFVHIVKVVFVGGFEIVRVSSCEQCFILNVTDARIAPPDEQGHPRYHHDQKQQHNKKLFHRQFESPFTYLFPGGSR